MNSAPQNITAFSGTYRFLSNFSPAQVTMDGAVYPTVEHAYQAAKTFDLNLRAQIARAESPREAKKLGNRVPLRYDWESVKLSIMRDLLRQKFSSGTNRYLLLQTANALLIEGNTWGDRFWGQVNGVGENHLGKLLMGIRAEMQCGAERVTTGQPWVCPSLPPQRSAG